LSKLVETSGWVSCRGIWYKQLLKTRSWAETMHIVVVFYSVELLTMGLQSCLLLTWILQICLLIQRWKTASQSSSWAVSITRLWIPIREDA